MFGGGRSGPGERAWIGSLGVDPLAKETDLLVAEGRPVQRHARRVGAGHHADELRSVSAACCDGGAMVATTKDRFTGSQIELRKLYAPAVAFDAVCFEEREHAVLAGAGWDEEESENPDGKHC